MENEVLNNLPPFYVGQKVVYITGKNMLKDSIHTVSEIEKSRCGCYFIWIGNEVKIKGKPFDYYSCVECGKISLGSFIHSNGWSSKSFRPLQESVFPSLTMSRVIEKERELVSMN